MFSADTYLSLLHSTVILAMSADGKIADFRRTAARFSSKADLAHLEAHIAEADAVLVGGGTLRAYGTTLPVRQPTLIEQRRQRGQSDQPIHIVWSPSGRLDPDCRFFRQAVPRGLLTTESGGERWQQQAGFDSIWALPGTASDWDWPLALAQLVSSGIRRLAVLGGGRLVAELIAQGLIKDLVLTVCPVVLGGAAAPTPVDGLGFGAEVAPRLELISCRSEGQEIFLHYRFRPESLQPQ
ncbi:MAG: RibD family protein [Cyanobacteria bacterium Co-bin8]|nr:RibD family protein [Cyanobacteria bacterium Co-bin8]